jgi:hypothetical protein
MVPEDTSILISFVLGGRNDSYLGDFKWRLSACVNYLAENLQALKRLPEAEIVVCDWNSETSLAAALNLGQDAGRITRFVRVLPAIAQEAQKDSPFPYVLVQNVGVRRARGRFIAQTDSDILYPRHSLEALFDILSGKFSLGHPIAEALFVASRRQLPLAVAKKQPGLEEIDRYLALYGNMLKLDRLSVGFLAPSALTLMHRSLWEACGGYDERLLYWEWMDIDLYLRVTQRCPWFDLANVGVHLYHLEHYPNADRLRDRKTNPWAVPTQFRNQNGASWGLWDHPLEIQVAQPTWSEPPASSAFPGTNPLTPSLSPSAEERVSEGRERGAFCGSMRESFGELAPRRDAFGKTSDELQREINSPAVIKHVQDAGKVAPSDPAEFLALCALAWHSLNFRPARYLEFGIRYANAAAVVALAYPAVEIYGIDSWKPIKGKPNVSIYYCAETLTRLEHRGYLRFITGDPHTALKRLCDGFVGKPAFDLVFFRGEAFGESAFPQAVDVLGRLSSGGMLVVAYESPSQFADFWRLFRCCPNEAEILELDNRTGLVLRRS